MLTTTVLNYAATIPDRDSRHKFLMELGKKQKNLRLTCLMDVETMNDILKSI